MNQVEKQADWIKKERAVIAKLSSEVNTLVCTYNLSEDESRPYSIDYGVSPYNIEVRISGKDHVEVYKKAIWCIGTLFEEISFGSFGGLSDYDRDKIKKVKTDLKEMKELVKKYIKLNTN